VASPRWVVGIGNPGPDYAATRHNAGFMIVDALAARLGAAWRPDGAGGSVATGRRGDAPFTLARPGTFVNRTGLAVARLRDVAGPAFDPSRLLVLVDDMALPLGRLRLRAAGSDGGHNGLRSVIAELETDAFPRLRAGIGGVPAAAWREHVLAPFDAEETALMERVVAKAAEIAEGFLDGRPLAELQAEANRAFPRKPVPGTGGPGDRGERRDGPPDRGARGESSLAGELQ